MSVTVDFTPRVYFSPELPKVNYIVTNDFWFVLNEPSESDGGGLKYPTVLISGLDRLYVDPDAQQKDYSSFTEQFIKLFTADTEGWHASADETVSPPKLKLSYTKNDGHDEDEQDSNAPKPSYPVRFTLSAKAAFPRVLDRKKSVDIKIKIEGDSPAEFTKPLSLMFAPYVCQFGAYVPGKTEPVTVLYHGEKCNISWSVSGDTKADVFVRVGDTFTNSQNSCELTLTKDTYCSFLLQSESVNMEYGFMLYRTLWKDTNEAASGLPEPPSNGHNKIFSYGKNYYTYVHPKLYKSADLKTWAVYNTNPNPPAAFTSYTVNFKENKIAICYNTATSYVYFIYQLKNNVQAESFEIRTVTVRDNSAFAFVLMTVPDSEETEPVLYRFLEISEGNFMRYDLINGVTPMNMAFYRIPDDVKVSAADVMEIDDKLYIAAIDENGRVYYIDYDNSVNNFVFADLPNKPERVYLFDIDRHYLVTKSSVLCAQTDKYSDINFNPVDGKEFYAGKEKGQAIKAFTAKTDENIWKYKY